MYLENVPGSVLWLLVGNSYAENALKQEAAAAGVAPERLVFAGLLPVARHLRRLQLADIALDTQIYNGHTTTSDALWAGIPVVTLRGSHFASRVSASCLAAAGLPQLIASTFGEFVALATRLGSDPQALQALKTHLGTQRMQVPLFDTRRFVRNLESAFDEAWRRYCCGMEPDHFAIIEPPSDGD